MLQEVWKQCGIQTLILIKGKGFMIRAKWHEKSSSPSVAYGHNQISLVFQKLIALLVT